MSEFTLPANSKVGEGKRWPAPQQAKHVKSFRIYRWDPAKNANPTLDTFEIDRDHCGPMVLDALVKINDEIDPSLSFRRSCREGVCGSCAMNIDGTNRPGLSDPDGQPQEGNEPDHAAAAYAGSEGPHPRLDRTVRPVRADRAVVAVRPAAPGPRTPPVAGGSRETRRHVGMHPLLLLLDLLPELLVESRTKYLGPSILLQSYRWLADSRDQHTGERLDRLEDPFRLYRCHTIMNCTRTCPKGLNPAHAIGRDQGNDGRARMSSSRRP